MTTTTAATTLRRRLSLAAAAVGLPLSIGVAIAQAPTQAEISAPATSASVTTDAPNSSSAKLLSIRDIYDRVDAAGTLVGILTNRDLRFETDNDQLISAVMTPIPLVTTPVGTTLDEARVLFAELARRLRGTGASAQHP